MSAPAARPTPEQCETVPSNGHSSQSGADFPTTAPFPYSMTGTVSALDLQSISKRIARREAGK